MDEWSHSSKIVLFLFDLLEYFSFYVVPLAEKERSLNSYIIVLFWSNGDF